MDTETQDKNGEFISNWKQIVQTLWMLNYVSVGFKGLFPRLQDMPQSLDNLAQVIPSIREGTTTDILESELREMMNQFVQVIRSLTLGQKRIGLLLSQLEEHRTEIVED